MRHLLNTLRTHRLALALTSILAFQAACGGSSDDGGSAAADTGGTSSAGGSAGSAQAGTGGSAQAGTGGAQAGGGGSAQAGTGGSAQAGASSGGAAGTGTGTAGSGGAQAGAGGGASSGYPAGPYGIKEGDTFPNLVWAGYANWNGDAISTTKTFGPVSMDDARKSGKKYAIINLAETLCPGCQKSASLLKTDAKGIIDAGGAVIEIVITKAFTGPPAKADLDAWITKYSLVNTAAMDPTGTGTPTHDLLGERDTAYIVELPSMKVKAKIIGSYSGATPGSIEKGFAQMKTLLAQ